MVLAQVGAISGHVGLAGVAPAAVLGLRVCLVSVVHSHVELLRGHEVAAAERGELDGVATVGGGVLVDVVVAWLGHTHAVLRVRRRHAGCVAPAHDDVHGRGTAGTGSHSPVRRRAWDGDGTLREARAGLPLCVRAVLDLNVHVQALAGCQRLTVEGLDDVRRTLAGEVMLLDLAGVGVPDGDLVLHVLRLHVCRRRPRGAHGAVGADLHTRLNLVLAQVQPIGGDDAVALVRPRAVHQRLRGVAVQHRGSELLVWLERHAVERGELDVVGLTAGDAVHIHGRVMVGITDLQLVVGLRGRYLGCSVPRHCDSGRCGVLGDDRWFPLLRGLGVRQANRHRAVASLPTPVGVARVLSVTHLDVHLEGMAGLQGCTAEGVDGQLVLGARHDVLLLLAGGEIGHQYAVLHIVGVHALGQVPVHLQHARRALHHRWRQVDIAEVATVGLQLRLALVAPEHGVYQRVTDVAVGDGHNDLLRRLQRLAVVTSQHLGCLRAWQHVRVHVLLAALAHLHHVLALLGWHARSRVPANSHIAGRARHAAWGGRPRLRWRRVREANRHVAGAGLPTAVGVSSVCAVTHLHVDVVRVATAQRRTEERAHALGGLRARHDVLLLLARRRVGDDNLVLHIRGIHVWGRIPLHVQRPWWVLCHAWHKRHIPQVLPLR